MKKREINKGSTVIEMTLLIPIFLGCIYFFIMYFLFLIDFGKQIDATSESLYSVKISSEGKPVLSEKAGDIKKCGTVIKLSVNGQEGLFDYDMTLSRNIESPVKMIRRWQLAASGF